MAKHDVSTFKTKSSYDVFLSFRGEDTRFAFTGYLYDALCRKGINTFMDDENLRIGESSRPQLLKAIEESKISIIVLSENYAASTWCLDELVKILECQKEKNQLVFPIFYKVEPSDARHQRNSYEKAMAAHANKFGYNSENVQKWRSALFGVSNITGYHLKDGYEFKFIQDIVNKVTAKLSPKQLPIEEHVGLQFRVAEVKSLLDIESDKRTFMLGILGTGGIGKTTLAKALYNSICYQFEGACFLFDVRKTSSQDKGQVQLQQILLSETLEEGKFELGSVEKGISTIKDRLSTKRLLIVLDDVDKIEQLKALAGGCDWFGYGSRIIITTRDKRLLVIHQIKKIYEMEVLNDRESLELFYQNAFKTSNPITNYEDLSNQAICYAKGLPLALKVIGSNLIDKDLKEWKSALDKYEKNPPANIQSILRISYDSLESDEKNIFLDIACFFNGQRLEYVKGILDGCDFYAEDGIRILVDKSLITVEDGYLRMHDLIQDMGREIVKQEEPKEVGERSRLFFYEDVLEVLNENTGSNKIEGIKLTCSEEVNCINSVFEKMKKLRILIVQNTTFSSGPSYLPNELRLLHWKGYPSKSFPAGFYPKKIAALILCCSPIVLEKPFQKFDQLTYMNFSDCQSITQFPDVSGAQNLRKLILNGCKKLAKVDGSVGFLPNLIYLSVSECTQLKSFLPRICLPSLEYLSFDSCKKLACFPDVLGNMDKPLKISMKHTAIKELPHSFADLGGLGYLDMTSCKELQYLPSFLFLLTKVVTLKIGGCSQLRQSLTRFKGSLSIAECWPNLETLHFSNACLSDEDVQVIMQSFPNLKDLNVASNFFVSFPPCIGEFICLTSLDVSYCLNLKEIPELPSSVQKVYARHCYSLTADTIGMLWSQVRKEKNRLEVVMPNTQIPEWWDYRDQGGIPTFWACGKFPVVALVFVFGKMKYQAVRLHLYIDGEHVIFHHQQLHNFTVAEHHVLLCDLRVLFSNEEWQRLDARVGHDNGWRSVQVNCETDMIVRHWGVYVNQQKTSVDDIQFKCPYPDSSGTHMFLMATNAITGPIDEEDEGPRDEEEEEEEESETTLSQEEDYLLFMRRVRRVFPPHNRDGLTARAFSKMVRLDTYEKANCWINETAWSFYLVALFVFFVATDVATLQSGCENNHDCHAPLVLLFFTDFSVALIISMAYVSFLLSMVMFTSVITYPPELPDFHNNIPRKLKLGFVFLFLSSVCTMLALSSTILLTIRFEKKEYSYILFYGAGFFPMVIIFLLMQFLFYKEVRRLVKRQQFLALKQLAPTTLINDFIQLRKSTLFPKRKPMTREQYLDLALTLFSCACSFCMHKSEAGDEFGKCRYLLGKCQNNEMGYPVFTICPQFFVVFALVLEFKKSIT